MRASLRSVSSPAPLLVAGGVRADGTIDTTNASIVPRTAATAGAATFDPLRARRNRAGHGP